MCMCTSTIMILYMYLCSIGAKDDLEKVTDMAYRQVLCSDFHLIHYDTCNCACRLSSLV